MARYSCFVLKVPLNTNQPTNQPIPYGSLFVCCVCVCQCVTYVVDCLLSRSPPYLVTAAKCLLIGRHTQLYERAIDILKQADDVIHFLSSLLCCCMCSNDLLIFDIEMTDRSYCHCHRNKSVQPDWPMR